MILRKKKKSEEPWASISEDNFEVKYVDEEIGFGLFSKKDFNNGSYLLFYDGKLLPRDLGEKIEQQNFVFFFKHKGENLCIDGSESLGKATKINHASIKSSKCNCIPKLVIANGSLKIVFRSTRAIKVGEEIRYDYGDRRQGAIVGNPWLKESAGSSGVHKSKDHPAEHATSSEEDIIGQQDKDPSTQDLQESSHGSGMVVPGGHPAKFATTPSNKDIIGQQEKPSTYDLHESMDGSELLIAKSHSAEHAAINMDYTIEQNEDASTCALDEAIYETEIPETVGHYVECATSDKEVTLGQQTDKNIPDDVHEGLHETEISETAGHDVDCAASNSDNDDIGWLRNKGASVLASEGNIPSSDHLDAEDVSSGDSESDASSQQKLPEAAPLQSEGNGHQSQFAKRKKNIRTKYPCHEHPRTAWTTKLSQHYRLVHKMSAKEAQEKSLEQRKRYQKNFVIAGKCVMRCGLTESMIKEFHAKQKHHMSHAETTIQCLRYFNIEVKCDTEILNEAAPPPPSLPKSSNNFFEILNEYERFLKDSPGQDISKKNQMISLKKILLNVVPPDEIEPSIKTLLDSNTIIQYLKTRREITKDLTCATCVNYLHHYVTFLKDLPHIMPKSFKREQYYCNIVIDRLLKHKKKLLHTTAQQRMKKLITESRNETYQNMTSIEYKNSSALNYDINKIMDKTENFSRENIDSVIFYLYCCSCLEWGSRAVSFMSSTLEEYHCGIDDTGDFSALVEKTKNPETGPGNITFTDHANKVAQHYVKYIRPEILKNNAGNDVDADILIIKHNGRRFAEMTKFNARMQKRYSITKVRHVDARHINARVMDHAKKSLQEKAARVRSHTLSTVRTNYSTTTPRALVQTIKEQKKFFKECGMQNKDNQTVNTSPDRSAELDDTFADSDDNLYQVQGSNIVSLNEHETEEQDEIIDSDESNTSAHEPDQDTDIEEIPHKIQNGSSTSEYETDISEDESSSSSNDVQLTPHKQKSVHAIAQSGSSTSEYETDNSEDESSSSSNDVQLTPHKQKKRTIVMADSKKRSVENGSSQETARKKQKTKTAPADITPAKVQHGEFSRVFSDHEANLYNNPLRQAEFATYYPNESEGNVRNIWLRYRVRFSEIQARKRYAYAKKILGGRDINVFKKFFSEKNWKETALVSKYLKKKLQ